MICLGAISAQSRPAARHAIKLRLQQNIAIVKPKILNKPPNNNFRVLIQGNKPLRENYLYHLRNSSPFASKEFRKRPDFTFETRDHPELTKLRVKYKLDVVVGNGDELSQIVKLMKWAHRVIPYNGMRGVPKTRNAMHIITQAGSAGFDCRGLATILNEAYLSMGFQSRLVVCFPKDTADNEHHVINAVYSRSLKKWIWMDPTNNAYVMDENHQYLSIEEVRERLIKGEKLSINADANVNNKSVSIKEYLYDYMVKNLYWFQSPLHSGYDTETDRVGKTINYVGLFPPGFAPYGKSDMLVNTGLAYRTESLEYFWQHPKGATLTVPKKSRRK